MQIFDAGDDYYDYADCCGCAYAAADCDADASDCADDCAGDYAEADDADAGDCAVDGYAYCGLCDDYFDAGYEF